MDHGYRRALTNSTSTFWVTSPDRTTADTTMTAAPRTTTYRRAGADEANAGGGFHVQERPLANGGRRLIGLIQQCSGLTSESKTFAGL